MGKLTISMAIFNSYFDITRGYFPGFCHVLPCFFSCVVPTFHGFCPDLPQISVSGHGIRRGALGRDRDLATNGGPWGAAGGDCVGWMVELVEWAGGSMITHNKHGLNMDLSKLYIYMSSEYGCVLKCRLNPIVPNGFADHYPVFKWLFHWEY